MGIGSKRVSPVANRQNDQALTHLAKSIEKNYAIEVAAMSIDLTQEDSLHRIRQYIDEKALEIDMLINNAGIGYTAPFEEHSLSFYQRLLCLNNIALVSMCSIVIPRMRSSNPTHVINIASIAGLLALPQKDVYAASKAFIYHFTRCLQRSYYQSSIQFSVVCPGAMSSNAQMFIQNSRLTPLSKTTIQSPETVAHIALAAVFAGKKCIIPSFSSRCALWLSKCLPLFAQCLLANLLLSKKVVKPGIPKIKKTSTTQVAPAFLPILQPL